MIDVEEDLPINLYHGTSSIFLPWIKRYGLGGFEILKEFELQTVFEDLCTVLEKSTQKSEWWRINSPVCKAMIANEVTTGGENFRFGQVYASPAVKTAIGYANSNEYGSEYLSILVKAYEDVKRISLGLAEQLFPYSPLRELIHCPNKPILITVTNLKYKDLSTEHGDDIQEQLEGNAIYEDMFCLPPNFTIAKIVPYDDLKIEYL